MTTKTFEEIAEMPAGSAKLQAAADRIAFLESLPEATDPESWVFEELVAFGLVESGWNQ